MLSETFGAETDGSTLGQLEHEEAIYKFIFAHITTISVNKLVLGLQKHRPSSSRGTFKMLRFCFRKAIKLHTFCGVKHSH